MNDRRYVVAYGDCFEWTVERAPESYGDDLLTRAEAAQRIVDEANIRIAAARETRTRAMRILRAERKKAAVTRNTGGAGRG